MPIPPDEWVRPGGSPLLTGFYQGNHPCPPTLTKLSSSLDTRTLPAAALAFARIHRTAAALASEAAAVCVDEVKLNEDHALAINARLSATPKSAPEFLTRAQSAASEMADLLHALNPLKDEAAKKRDLACAEVEKAKARRDDLKRMLHPRDDRLKEADAIVSQAEAHYADAAHFCESCECSHEKVRQYHQDLVAAIAAANASPPPPQSTVSLPPPRAFGLNASNG